MRSKQEAIALADAAREERRLARAKRLAAMTIIRPEVDGVPILELMEQEITEVRTPVGAEVARADYRGHLGGGSPQNPLRVGGIVH